MSIFIKNGKKSLKTSLFKNDDIAKTFENGSLNTAPGPSGDFSPGQTTKLTDMLMFSLKIVKGFGRKSVGHVQDQISKLLRDVSLLICEEFYFTNISLSSFSNP